MLRSYLVALLAIAGLAGQSAGIDFQSGPARAVQDITVSATADDVEFIHFDFQRLGLYELDVHYGPIDGEPSIGVQYGAKASIDGEAALKNVSFDAIDAGGATIQRIVIARQVTGFGVESEFIGLMTVPDRPFRIRLSGQTMDGRTVRRTFERRFEPTAAPPDDRPYPPGLPPETASAFQRMFDALAPAIVAERQALIAGNGSERIALPHTRVSNVLYAPLLSEGGRPIGIRVTYDVTFSQSGEYTPELSIHAMRKAGTRANSMYVLRATIDPRPHEVQAPHREAENVGGGGLIQATNFLYVGDRTYRFVVELVPEPVRVDKHGTYLCSEPRVDRDAAATLAERSAPDTQSDYRLSIAGRTFEGTIADFYNAETLYQNLIAEGLQSCQ